VNLNFSKQTRIGGIWALVALCAAALLILVTAYRLDRLLYSSYIQQVRSDTYFELLEVREGFEEIIHSQSLVLRELATLIGENPNITQDEYATRVREIRGLDDSMISIAAAPDMVISLIYPAEENQGALGLNYRENSEQLPTVLKMMQTGSDVITGPVNLVQGGLGLILRAPVYHPDADSPTEGETVASERALWGIVSLVLDYNQFLVESGIVEAEENYDLLIDIAENSNGTEGSFVYGDPSLLEKDPVKIRFDFAFENWVLHAVTKGGWPKTSPDQWFQRIVMVFAGLVLLGTLIYILRLSHTRKRAELLLNRGIEALDDGFVMFDENGLLLLSNSKYRAIYDLPEEVLRPGTPYRKILLAGLESRKFNTDNLDQAAWLEHRLHLHRSGKHVDIEQRLLDGRVIKVSNHPLADGGYVGLRVDVTELSRAKEAAEAASEAKTNFMGVLSHELRTPLTVIMGVAQLLQNVRLLSKSKALLAAYEEGSVTPAEAKTLLDELYEQLNGLMGRMTQSGDHLLHLINEILDITKIESGSLIIEPTLCRVEDIVDPVVQQLNTLTSKKGLDFEVVQEAETVFADKVRARQILFNLIGNAIKFTDAGFVRLIVKVDADMVRFEVHDSGMGISEDQFASIFDVFYQVDSTATRRAGGTGMGLAISKSLAELQHGGLAVTSVMGSGSCFVLSQPVNAI
jgi:two-component system cell cycle sensor histidine kinase PleC